MKTQDDHLPEQILQMIAKPHYEDYGDNKGNSSSLTSLHIVTPHHRLNAVINNSRNEDSLLLKELSQQLKKHRFIKKQSSSFQTALNFRSKN